MLDYHSGLESEFDRLVYQLFCLTYDVPLALEHEIVYKRIHIISTPM